jgi:5-methylcytosine-specific restriction endonuclease McrA
MNKEIYVYLEEVYGNTCVLCFGDGNHPHHIVPRSAGGEDVEENIVPLCTDCHRDVHERGAKNCVEEIEEKAKLVRAVYEN